MDLLIDAAKKIIIRGSKLYQEIKLNTQFSKGVVIGTTCNSKIRFDRNDFFCDFEIRVVNNSLETNVWSVMCNRSIYIDGGGISRKYSSQLHLGDRITFRYSESDAELLVLSFELDFDDIPCDYNRKIDVHQIKNLCIGGTDFSRIQKTGGLIQNDYITLTQQGRDYVVNVNQVLYGLYVNGVEIKDKIFTLRDRDFITIDGWKLYYKDYTFYTDSMDVSIKSKIGDEIVNESKNSFSYPKFVKNVRLKNVLSDEDIKVLPPDSKINEEKENIFVTLLPSIVMLAVMMILRTQMNSNPMFAVYMGVMMGMGIVTSLVSHIKQKSKKRKDEQERVEKYTRYMKEKEEDIQLEREREKKIREEIYIDTVKEIQEVNDFDYHLFEKTKLDDDFMTIRLGSGTIQAGRKLDVKELECISSDDPLQEYPELLKNAYEKIDNAPLTLDLKEQSVVGIVGNEDALFSFLKIITLDLVTRHYFEDLKIYFKFSSKDEEKFKPLRWLQNLYMMDNSFLRNFIFDKVSQKVHLELLYKELSSREGLAKEQIADLPYVVVMITDMDGFASHPVSNFLKRAKELHFVFIFFVKYREQIPKEAKALILLKKDNDGELILSENRGNIQKFVHQSVSNDNLANVSRRLGCVYVESVNLESTLTKNISLYKLLGIISEADLDLKTRWSTSKVYESMAAPLGVRAGDSVVCLDLNEKAHGPHGLVAGTTGSGKSEILQSYILSMATLFSPEDVCFVIIDFKGGGMANQFKKLPHLIGAITNIDGDAIDRSLLSIRAELRKRQAYFKEYNVNHIDSYIKLYKAGKASMPLPHLILIVDEFAELKSDQPEFMQELISTARIGRSLGVHLILATQKPAGVVNDQIWSNSKFKLCLKVQNKEDSNEVLHSPLAAEIREPGRAYLQVGNNEIFELFQSAYSGSSIDSEKSGQKSEYQIREVNLLGQSKTVFEQKNEKRKNQKSQLEALVEYVADYCRNEAVPEVSGICLPELPVCLTDEEVAEMKWLSNEGLEKKTEVVAEVGVIDDPDRQSQFTYSLNLSSGHTLIIGAPQYGKTNLLQQVLKSIMTKYSAAEVNVYILDFASMALKNFENSKMVGGVVTASDDDRYKHFILMLQNEIARRKGIFASKGLSSFAAYKEAGNVDIPQIVVLIDNFMGVKELYLQREDDLLSIVREGISLGISFVMTDLQTSSLGFRYLSLFTNKIVLYCNNDSEYSSVFGVCRKKVKSIPGRALVEISKKIYFMQTFLSFSGEREIDRVSKILDNIDKNNLQQGKALAVRIPEVPELFTMEMLDYFYDSGMKRKEYCPVFGIEFDTAAPDYMQLSDGGSMAIVGGEVEVRNTFVNNVIYQLINNNNSRAKITIFDDYKRAFQSKYENDLVGFTSNENGVLSDSLHDVQVITTPEAIIDVLSNINEYGMRVTEDLKKAPEVIEELPLQLLIIQNKEVIDIINKDRKILELYKNIITKYHNYKIKIIFTCIENIKLGYSGVDVERSVMEARDILFMDSINQIRLMDIQPGTKREFGKPLTKTEALYYKNGDFQKYKLLV